MFVKGQENSIRIMRAMMFPGQGSQFVGMGKYTIEDKSHRLWCDDLLHRFSETLNQDIRKLMLEGPHEELSLTENAQPAIFINSFISLKKYQLERNIDSNSTIQNQGDNISSIYPYAIGNSVGEYSALVAAGSIDPFATAKLLQQRGKLMQQACKDVNCGMLAILTSDDQLIKNTIEQIKINQFPKSVCQIAVFASNKQLILSGEEAPLKAIQTELKRVYRIPSTFLQVSAAFHCSLLTPIKAQFKSILEEINILPPTMTIFRNTDLKPYVSKEDIIQGLVNQLDQPVLFRQAFQKILDVAINSSPVPDKIQFLELGTTGLLAKLGKDISANHLQNSKEFVEFHTVH